MKENIFKLRKTQFITDETTRFSSVCIPMVTRNDKQYILFTVRSSKIESQPGDICFPGGMIENGEKPDDAAIREITEELLIKPNQVEMMGPSDIFVSMGIIIYPFVVKLNDYENTYSSDEVSEVFEVPLEYFLKNEPEKHIVNWNVEVSDGFPYEKIIGGKKYKWRDRKDQVLFYEYDGHIIWGLTAKMSV